LSHSGRGESDDQSDGENQLLHFQVSFGVGPWIESSKRLASEARSEPDDM
jgi:hypothetical protein